jgi:plastocyanin
MRPGLLAAPALFVALLAGCSSPSEQGAEVAIHGNTFDPASATIDAGEHVQFVNHDSVKHSVTADSGGSFDKDVAGNGEADVEFSSPGTYAFHCKYHPAMKGTVIVR